VGVRKSFGVPLDGRMSHQHIIVAKPASSLVVPEGLYRDGKPHNNRCGSPRGADTDWMSVHDAFGRHASNARFVRPVGYRTVR
jgi:hypothetical protein